MCTVKVEIKWGKMKKKDTLQQFDALYIQGVPVAYISTTGNWGYAVHFVDGKSLPSKKGKYYQRLNTAMRHCERKLGIYSDRLRNLYLTYDPNKRDLAVNI